MKLTPKQAAILRECKNLGGTITKKDAVRLIGDGYYHNAEKYVGEVLATMVKSGLIVRVKMGHYKLGKGGKAATADNNQTELF
jgi:hypothetical protein